MFDKLRGFLSDAIGKVFSKTSDDAGYGNEDFAVYPPAVSLFLHTPKTKTPDYEEVIGDVVTVPEQFFTDRAPKL